jgi:hypothetical protein
VPRLRPELGGYIWVIMYIKAALVRAMDSIFAGDDPFASTGNDASSSSNLSFVPESFDYGDGTW